MKKTKAQVGGLIIAFFFIFLIIMLGYIAIKYVKNLEKDKIDNAPPEEFGENIPADKPKDIAKKIENKTVAPDILAIG